MPLGSSMSFTWVESTAPSQGSAEAARRCRGGWGCPPIDLVILARSAGSERVTPASTAPSVMIDGAAERESEARHRLGAEAGAMLGAPKTADGSRREER